MRVLVLPNHGGQVLGYAPFEQSRAFAMGIVEQFEDAYFDIVLPTLGENGFDYDLDKVKKYLEHPRIATHFAPMLTSGINGWGMSNQELYYLFNLQKTMLFYDAVWSCRMNFSPVLKRMLKMKFERGNVNVPVFNFTGRVTYPETFRGQKYNYYGEDEVISETAGYLLDYNFFWLEAEKRLAMENARKYLSPSMVKRVKENSLVTACGLDCDAIDAKRANTPERTDKRVCLFFGGRFASQKGFNEVIDLMDHAHQSGRDVRCVCTTPEPDEGEIAELRKKHPHIEFYPNCGRDEFHLRMAEGDVFFCFSTVESYGISYWEMLYSGLVGVFVESDFAKEVLPDGYPYVAKSVKDMMPLTMTVINNLESGRGWVTKARAKLKEHHWMKTEFPRAYDWMCEKTKEHMAGEKLALGGMLDLVNEALVDAPEPISFTDVCTRMTQKSHAGRAFGRKGDMISRFYLRALILHAGWRDLCDATEPRFVKA